MLEQFFKDIKDKNLNELDLKAIVVSEDGEEVFSSISELLLNLREKPNTHIELTLLNRKYRLGKYEAVNYRKLKAGLLRIESYFKKAFSRTWLVKESIVIPYIPELIEYLDKRTYSTDDFKIYKGLIEVGDSIKDSIDKKPLTVQYFSEVLISFTLYLSFIFLSAGLIFSFDYKLIGTIGFSILIFIIVIVSLIKKWETKLIASLATGFLCCIMYMVSFGEIIHLVPICYTISWAVFINLVQFASRKESLNILSILSNVCVYFYLLICVVYLV